MGGSLFSYRQIQITLLEETDLFTACSIQLLKHVVDTQTGGCESGSPDTNNSPYGIIN